GTAAKRCTQHTYEGNVITRVVEHAKYIDQVDHFLPAVEVFFPLDHIGNVVAAERIEVRVGLRELAKQKGDVTGGDIGAAEDVFLQPTSQDFTFCSTRSRGIEG